MSRTSTIFIDLQKLSRNGNFASIIIRLMMAFNDISLANVCLSKFKEKQSPMSKHMQQGALMYFVRLQCGHLNEALKIIEDIRKNQYLCNIVDRNCTQKTREAFDKLTRCLEGGVNYNKFKNYIQPIRHRTAFHYDEKLICKVLSDISKNPQSKISRITLGDHISRSRFEIADDIVDNIVCREIWKIPKNANVIQQANLISDFGSDLCKCFLEFSGEFIYRCIHAYKAI